MARRMALLLFVGTPSLWLRLHHCFPIGFSLFTCLMPVYSEQTLPCHMVPGRRAVPELILSYLSAAANLLHLSSEWAAPFTSAPDLREGL